MKKQEDTENFSLDELELIKQFKINYTDNSSQLWDEFENKLQPKKLNLSKSLISYAIISKIAAAFILLFISVLTFSFNYSETFTANKGEHLNLELPDGSVAELNAESRLDYKPYWWYFSRIIYFEGEAFFKVNKGKKFTVISRLGQTQVLGTSFNINTRDNEYHVLCKHGKVAVKAKGRMAKLSAGELFSTKNKNIEIKSSSDADKLLGWRKNEFYFDNVEFGKVLETISRQYNVDFHFNQLNNYYFSGSFNRKSLNQTLRLVCLPLNLKFTIKRNNQVIISDR